MLSTGTKAIKESAAGALWYLSNDDGNKVVLAANNDNKVVIASEGIEPLIGLLETTAVEDAASV